MATACSCEVSFLNTGTPNCIPAYKIWKKFIVVALTANDGTDNYISSSDTLDASYFSAKTNHVDASKRWFPLPAMKNVESTKADNITETFNDQSVLFVQEGVRGINALLVGQGPTMVGQLKTARCSQFGVYAVDGDGSLYGYTNNTADKLYPIPVDNNTWAPVWEMPSDTTVQKIKLTFQFDANLQDEYIGQIVSNDITGVNLFALRGLIDVDSTVVSCSQTQLVVKLYTKYGSAFNKLPIEGLAITDFYSSVGGTASRLYNVTDSAAVTISAMTESPDGTYTFTYASQTVADVIRITPVKTGYDFTNVISNTATVA